MTYLLDVNVLIALIDPTHIFNDLVNDWFASECDESWATCPLTENGVIRVVAGVRYPNSPGSPAIIASLVAQFCAVPGHQFWPDEISLVRSTHVDVTMIASSAQVTDTYLLALAVSRGAKLATLDRKLSTLAVTGGADSLHVID